MARAYTPKPATAAWIQRERKRLSLSVPDLRERLRLMGIVVTDQTIRVWEGNSDRPPGPQRLDALERIFGSQAPERPEAPDNMALVTALQEQTAAISALVERLGTPVREEPAPYAAEPRLTGDAAARRMYWLRRARERLAMNREEVDRRLRLSAGQYGRWEDGVSTPKGVRLTRLAELLRIPVGVLEDPPVTDEDRLAAWQADTITTQVRRSA